jgi:hypothetical protein
VVGWSEFGFSQFDMTRAGDGPQASSGSADLLIPVLGLVQHAGAAVEPPTTSGHPIAGEYQIELGTVTMGQLGLHLGDQVRILLDNTCSRWWAPSRCRRWASR